MGGATVDKHVVFLGRCDEYDSDRILETLKRGLEAVEWKRPFAGRITVKPNGVFAHHVHARNCYTRPEFLEAVARLLREGHGTGDKPGHVVGAAVGQPATRPAEIRLVEKSGVGMATSRVFARAGWTALRRYGVRLVATDEARKVRVKLKKGMVHHEVTVAREMVDRDFLVFTPKLKSNVLAHGMTAALKLNIGTLDDRERMYHHHYDLDDKIVDLLEVARPDLVLTDAIDMGYGGNQMTERAFHLGLVVVATNPLAHDLVTARILNLDPLKIGHLRRAIERGYLPSHPNQVVTVGDVTIPELQARTAGLDLGYMPVTAFRSPVKVVSGTPYCTGGCQGVLLDWLHMLKDRKPGYLARLRPFTVVVGETEEDVRGPAVLIGDCALKSPKLKGRGIPSVGGCPPTHRNIILFMGLRQFVFAPFFRLDLIVDAFVLRPLKLLWAKRHGAPQPWPQA